MRGIHRLLMGLLATATLLLAAGPASAALLITPLRIETPGGNAVEVGDDKDFTVAPWEEGAAGNWSGKAVRVIWRDLADEAQTGTIRDALTLDEKAAGRFHWTIPAAVDGKNIFVVLLGDKDELLAELHLAVGDAEPVLFNRGGPADTGPIDQAPQSEGGRTVPGPGALTAVLALAGIAAVLVAVRPGK